MGQVFVKASSRARAYVRGGLSSASRGKERRLLHGKMGNRYPTETPLHKKRIGDAKIRLTQPGLSRAQKNTIRHSIRSLRKYGVITRR